MYFAFSPEIQALIDAGKYAPVFSKKYGTFLGIVRDVSTGQFVSIAKFAEGLQPLVGSSNLLFGGSTSFAGVDSVTGIPNLILNGYNTYQSGKILNQGRETLQAVKALAQSVSLLQATTAVIGVGVAATAALSAVNLYHTLKLRQDVATLRLEVKDGFIDLKQALQVQGLEVIQHIDRVAEDVEFRHHRTILASAYGRFKQAIAQLQLALQIQDLARRNDDIQAARNMLFQALADYDNPQLLTHMNAAAYIRRRECVWAIQQAIAFTYQLQGDLASVSHQLRSVSSTIRQDSLQAIDQIDSQAELDFLFPELVRIHDHDLQALTLWEAQTDWLQTLPPDEMKMLNESDWTPVDLQMPEYESEVGTEIPAEQTLYEELQPKANAITLCDQLRIMMNPDLRLEYATMISQRAQSSGLHALTLDNLQTTSDYAIANLYHYFHVAAKS